MNNEQAINPGYLNLIIPLSEMRVNFNKSYFMNGEVEDKGIQIIYDIDCFPEYIKLAFTLNHSKTGMNDNSELNVFTAFFSFKVLKVSEMTANDFLILLQYCVDRVNQAGKNEIPKLNNPIADSVSSLWEINRTVFDNIANSVNHCSA